MLCPICSVDLMMTERQGVEIDYCPKCRGVWLDRGELDKIIERSASLETSARKEEYPDSRGREKDQDKIDYDENNHDSYQKDKKRNDGDGKGYPHRKRESFLGDLFDFGG